MAFSAFQGGAGDVLSASMYSLVRLDVFVWISSTHARPISLLWHLQAAYAPQEAVLYA